MINGPFPAITSITDPSNVGVALIQGTTIQRAPLSGLPFQPIDADLTTIAGLTPAAGAVMIGNGSNWTADATPTLTGLLTTNGQVAFPATQNPSSDPNTLDDYEEGTWTPSLTFATPGNLSIAYSVRVGDYAKVGNRAALSFQISTSTFTHTSASGALRLTGIPFNIGGTAPHIGSITISGFTAAGFWVNPRALPASSTFFDFVGSTSGAGRIALNTTHMPTGGTVIIEGTIIYQVA